MTIKQIELHNFRIYKDKNPIDLTSKNGKNIFVLNSDSSFYQSYEVKFSQIAEIWEYAGSIERGTFKTYENEIPPLENVIRKLQTDMMEIRALYKGI